MKRLVPIMAAALALAACSSPSPDHHNMSNAGQEASAARYETVFRLPVLPGRPGAAYFSVSVPADHGALIGVTSPQAGRIEMHETIQQGSMTGMRRVERIAPELGQLVLMPRGRHLMLFEVSPSLAPGDTAQLVLRFEHGQTRTLDARAIEAGGEHGGH